MRENNRILIVDDEPKNLKILRIRLEADYELKEARSGEEALEVIEDFDPALVLLDIMMEGVSGYDVTEKIKSNPKLKNCKIILVSGKALIEEKLQGYQCGAEDYITKPFNGEELKAKVKVFLKLYNLENQLEQFNKSLEKEVMLRSEQLLKSERMAYVGLHAGEIVHNLKNPLTVIKLIIRTLKKKYPDLKEVSGLDSAADKILEIIKNILSSIGHDIKAEMEEHKVNELVQEEVTFFQNLDFNFKNKMELKLDLNSKDSIFASKTHITQILNNLIKNAIEAMESSEEKVLSISSEDRDSYIVIKVKDTGEGISSENMEKVLEPLFTTKDGQDGGQLGNGLGLSFCKRMAETYGGQIEIASEEGKGTEITFKIPAGGAGV